MNYAVGASAGRLITTGTDNVLMGYSAGGAITDGTTNTVVGCGALQNNNVTGNVAVGRFAGLNCDGDNNVYLGRQAGYGDAAGSTGDTNVCIGYNSGYALTSGYNNTAVGAHSLDACTTGYANVQLGMHSGGSMTTGNNNICLGYAAGKSITTADLSICIGSGAGHDTTPFTTGTQCLYVGWGSHGSGGGNSQEQVIGTGLTGKGGSTTFLKGNVYNSANTSSFSTTSDRRIKKNIVDNNTGLSAINQITVRNFEYRTQDEITDFDNPASAVVEKEGVQLGVIAQEIESILPDVVKEETTGCLSVNPDNLTWYLVNAIKELSTKNDELVAANTALAARVTALES